MVFIVANRRKSVASLQREYGDAHIIDVTSQGPFPWLRFSPFYPHGNIPVPFSPGSFSLSVEGIWQGLKVFEHADIDLSKFTINTMKGIKRSTKKHGNVLGHRNGVNGDQLLSYREARRTIYVPSYHWILDHCLQDLLNNLKALEEEKPVILLDYETNSDIENISKPLSHASLIVSYIVQL